MTIRSRLAELVLVAMMIGGLLSVSCSSAPSSPTSSGASTYAKPYGTLTISGEFRSGNMLDASGKAVDNGGPFSDLSAAIFETLIMLTPDAQPAPGLAERWEISPDGKSHTFYIRKGVKFHNGDDLTGADVKFTFDNVLTASTIATAALWKNTIASVDFKDDYTVVLRMKAPQFELLKGIGSYDGSGAVVPKKYIEERGWDYFGRNLVGSGAWKIVKLEPGSRLELDAVENHWRATPQFKSVTILNVKDESTKVAMLKTGELDMAGAISPDSVPGLKAAGLRPIGHYGQVEYYAVPFWDFSGEAPFSDQRVRKSLSLAINRKELAATIFGGFAQPSASFRAPRTADYFDPNVLKPDPYDPEQAKRLLAEAGHANGFTTKLWDSGSGGSLTTGNLALAGYWRKIGVSAEITPIDRGALIVRYRPKPGPDIWNTILAMYSTGGTLGSENLVQNYHSTKGTFKNLNDPNLDELIDRIQSAADPAERKRLALQVALQGKNANSITPILDLDTIFVLGPKVGGFTPLKVIMGMAPALDTVTHAK